MEQGNYEQYRMHNEMDTMDNTRKAAMIGLAVVVLGLSIFGGRAIMNRRRQKRGLLHQIKNLAAFTWIYSQGKKLIDYRRQPMYQRKLEELKPWS